MPGKLDQQDSLCKLFIGGITLNTDEDALRQFYTQWGGEITDVVVMRDPTTKRSRGFGFVTFATSEQLDVVMDNRPHVIDGKEIDPKRAVPRSVSFNNKPESHMSVKRIYISGIKDEHNEDNLKEYFLKFGTISEVHIVVDKNTGTKRGFAFITYDDYDSADKAVLNQPHYIEGKRCDVKKALSREETKKVQQQEQDRFQRGQRSRGTGRGGRGGGPAGGQGGYYGGGGGGYGSGDWNQNGGGYGQQQGGWSQGGGGGGWNQQQPGGWNQGGGAAGGWQQPSAAGGWQGGAAAGSWQQPSYGGGQWDQSGGQAAANPQWQAAAANWQTQGGYGTGASQATGSDFASD